MIRRGGDRWHSLSSYGLFRNSGVPFSFGS